MPKPSQQRPPQEQDRQPGREDEMVPQPRYEGEGYRQTIHVNGGEIIGG